VVSTSDDIVSAKKDRQFHGYETGIVGRILLRAYTAS